MPKDLKFKAINALSKYLNAGASALGYLDNQQTEKFWEAIYARTAAYHNFLALDKKLQDEYDIDLALDDRCLDLWSQTQIVNNKLEKLMSQAKIALTDKVRKLSKSGIAMQKYQGGNSDRLAPKFIRTI